MNIEVQRPNRAAHHETKNEMLAKSSPSEKRRSSAADLVSVGDLPLPSAETGIIPLAQPPRIVAVPESNKVSRSSFQAQDGKTISTYKWLPDRLPAKGVVQIMHGLSEHAMRYDKLAQFLNQCGYAVYAIDQRGHGHTAEQGGVYGSFANENGWAKVIQDNLTFNKIMKRECPGIPTYFLAHSLGTVIARDLLNRTEYQDRDIVDGMILSGVPRYAGVGGKAGRYLAKVISAIWSPTTPSPMLDKIAFGSFNDKFKPNRSKFDWLSRDQQEVEKYLADPMSGKVATAGFFVDFLDGMEKVNESKKVHKAVPSLLLFGSHDPVAGEANGIEETTKKIKEQIKSVDRIVYTGARHEVLNETNRLEVFQDLVEWLNAQQRPSQRFSQSP